MGTAKAPAENKATTTTASRTIPMCLTGDMTASSFSATEAVELPPCAFTLLMEKQDSCQILKASVLSDL